MKNFFKILAVGVIIFLILALVMLLIAYGLSYLMQVVPCNVLLYVETGLLFIITLLIALVINKSTKDA